MASVSIIAKTILWFWIKNFEESDNKNGQHKNAIKENKSYESFFIDYKKKITDKPVEEGENA